MSQMLRFAVIAAMMALPAIAFAGDTEIAQQIVKSLQEQKTEGSLKGFNIGLRVEEGVVWLEGHVANEDQHELALEIVRRIEGVKRVVDGVHFEAARPADQVETESLVPTGVDRPESAQPEDAQQEAGMFDAEQPQLVPASLADVSGEPRGVLVNHSESMDQANSTQPSTPARQGSPMSQGQATGSSDTMRPIRPETQQPRSQHQGYASHQGGSQTPLAMSAAGSNAYPQYRMAGMAAQNAAVVAQPPAYYPAAPHAMPVRYDQPHMPGYAWPAYAAHPNYAAVTYPKQYSPAAWPYIGPFYPYPQVPLGWRKVSMEWDKGWWTVDFKAH